MATEGDCCDVRAGGRCRVESLLTVDERGQMVLPKDLREKAGIKAGDKWALVSWEKDGRVCCLTLMRAEDLIVGVQTFLEPIMGGRTVNEERSN